MRRIIPYLLLFLTSLQCRDKYQSPVQAAQTGFLVVEGFISSDTSATLIRLTRSVQLDSAHTVPVPAAAVMLESEKAGVVSTLAETGNGFYSGHLPGIDFSDRYRLHLNLAGKEYLSDYSSPRNTPQIDSVTWSAETDGVNIYVYTHDASAQTRNYRWEYTENWRYHSAYESEYLYKPQTNKILVRDSSQQIYTCYHPGNSTSVNVASSTGLSADVISKHLITRIAYLGTNRLSDMYSINVIQHAISQEALDYYGILAKNTEELGSVFDAQPSQLTGNIHSSADPGEPVFGFVECSGSTEKRIYIRRTELPDVPITTGHGGCEVKTASLVPEQYDSVFIQTSAVPISGTVNEFGFDAVYSNAICVDCTIQGGTTVKPAFWP